jgi:hypothetical protein
MDSKATWSGQEVRFPSDARGYRWRWRRDMRLKAGDETSGDGGIGRACSICCYSKCNYRLTLAGSLGGLFVC